eukprot:snap_masked-scaffold_39-processed-gene-2.45-mRNA-1 protein AED:1.00 eAED:1.00 QI:0/0/0/0/1/1/2/0/65
MIWHKIFFYLDTGDDSLDVFVCLPFTLNLALNLYFHNLILVNLNRANKNSGIKNSGVIRTTPRKE